MRRALLLVVTFALVASACNVNSSTSPTPARTADIQRVKLDIAYSAFVDKDVHQVTSRKALQAAIDALNAEAKRTGGKDDFPALELQDTPEPQLSDFRKFADAAAQFAARNSQISANRFADVAIAGMITASPDCHTSYVPASGGTVFRSRPVTPSGGTARVPAAGTVVFGPDDNGVLAKVLPDGIAYVTFRQWLMTGTYKVTDEVRKALDRAVAAGAKAWIFDLRANPGGNGWSVSASWFLDGEPMTQVRLKNGNAGTSTAFRDYRLPAQYQLPIAIVLNDRSASATEFFALALKENNRATLVGGTTIGCLGATSPHTFTDNAKLSVVVEEVIGAVTGTAYNNKGIPPDVAADEATAVDKAIEVLRAKL
jgi:hypothetical protein